MMNTKELLKNRRIELNLTLKDVANACGVSESTVSRWETGDIENMRRDKIFTYSKILQISPAVVMGWEDEKSLPPYSNIRPLTKRSLPVLGSAACDKPILMEERIEFYADQLESIHADYILIAKGDSMIGARIHDGDLVFIKKQDILQTGEIGAIAIADEATLKRYYYYPEKNLLILKAENPAYEDQIYQGAELDEIHVLGKVVAFQSSVR